MSTIAERVARGAAWLDANEPDWLKRIDVTTLRLSSSCKCVMGQLFGNFRLRPAEMMPLDVAAAHGFECDDVEWTDEYPRLTAEWRRVITERRAAE